MDKKIPVEQIRKSLVKSENLKYKYHLFFLWVIIAIVSLIRYRLIAVPFERDEGEYGYIGSLFLHGIAPFKDAYSMKLPGTSFMYALFMLIFGHSSSGVHLGLVFMNAATMFFLFASFKKLFNPFIGIAIATIYGFMAIGSVFDGFAAHATHFICFYSSIALLFLADFIKSGKLLKVFLAGLMFGMAFLMKQQAVFMILFGAVFLFIYLKIERKRNIIEIIKNLFIFSIGVLIPYIIVVLIVIFTGQFHIFWLWTVQYASAYEAVKNIHDIIGAFKFSFLPAWGVFYLLWIVALAGILVLYQSSYTRLQKLFVLLYFIASICVLSVGFYFRNHYFIVLIPVIGLLVGIFIEFVITQIRQRLNILKSSNTALIILLIIVCQTIYINRKYFFSYTPKQISSIVYWGNPFTEAQEISKYIHDNTSDTDKIAILGSEPEIYFYCNRMAATGYLYTYPLVEKQPYNEFMQEQMIQEIEKNKPTFIVYCYITNSWLNHSGVSTKIFTWAKSYTYKNYTPVGYDDFFSNSGWMIYWNNDVKNRMKSPDLYMIIFKRKPKV